MLQTAEPGLGGCVATDSLGRPFANGGPGVRVPSGASGNTYGSWTLIYNGSQNNNAIYFSTFQINGVRTSAGVIAATTLNAFIDIGIGQDASAVDVVAEKLGAPNCHGLGVIYATPLRIPPNANIYARHQNTAALANCNVHFSGCSAIKNVYALPYCVNIRALGAVTASTTGQVLQVGASGAEGAWEQVIAATTEDYVGVMVSPLFNQDTTLTANIFVAADVGRGTTGAEIVLGENLSLTYVWSANEQKDAICVHTFSDIPSGSRIVVRASSNTTPDSINSIVVYGLVG